MDFTKTKQRSHLSIFWPMSNRTHSPKFSRFRQTLLDTVTTEMTPTEVADQLGADLQRVHGALWHLAREGHLTRPYRGTYAPKETAA